MKMAAGISDQDDLPERSDQVRYMSKIYGQARSCIVYLGERDEYSKLALEVVQMISDDKATGKHLKQREMGKVRVSVVRQMASLSKEQKNALSVLLARRYFTRVWCLQEVILAREVVGTIGSLVFDFMTLFYLGQLVAFAKTDLTVLGLDTFTIGDRKFSASQSVHPQPYQSALNLGALGGAKKSLQRGVPPGFLDVVAMVFICDTTDERDRIYGVLAISDELRRGDEPTMPVDYHLSVDKVFANATAAFSLRRDDVEFLSLVGEHKHMKHQNLPSWCPDYSTRHFWIRNLGDASGWHIGSFWSSAPKVNFLDNCLLVVDGIRYDTLAGVATAGVFHPSHIIQCARPSQLLDLVLKLRRDEPQRSSFQQVHRVTFTDCR